MIKFKCARSALLVAALLVASFFGAPAMADPPAMPALVSPVTLSSIATEITVYGGAALLAWAGVYVVFRIIKRFIRGTAKAV